MKDFATDGFMFNIINIIIAIIVSLHPYCGELLRHGLSCAPPPHLSVTIVDWLVTYLQCPIVNILYTNSLGLDFRTLVFRF